MRRSRNKRAGRRLRAGSTLALAVAATGCTFDDGEPWGAAEVSLRASFDVPAARVRPDGSIKTARDFALRLDEVRVVFGTFTVGVTADGGPSGFDPAAPPEGFSLCHNGHCHGADGKLYSYAEVAAAASGGAADTAPALTLDVGDAGGVALGDAPVDVALSGCPCDLPRGALTAARLTVTGLRLRGTVTDLRPVSRLSASTVDVELDLPFEAVFSTPLDGRIDRGEPVDVALSATLAVSAKLLDALDFSLPEQTPDITENLAESVRTDSAFEIEITR